jgi:signal transduction histidine kinase
LEHDIETALTDIRRLVYDLRPPALDQLGLVAAIRQSAAQYSALRKDAQTLSISVDATEPLPPLPAAVEVAAFRIAQEAMTNVVHHAHAHTCRVHLHCGDKLFMEITDNGDGVPSIHRAGVGFSSMRERAEELGGSCIIERRDRGGTRVHVELPIVDRELH